MGKVGNYLKMNLMHTLSYWGLKCQLECAESDLNVSEFTVIWVHCVNRVPGSSVEADFNTEVDCKI